KRGWNPFFSAAAVEPRPATLVSTESLSRRAFCDTTAGVASWCMPCIPLMSRVWAASGAAAKRTKLPCHKQRRGRDVCLIPKSTNGAPIVADGGTNGPATAPNGSELRMAEPITDGLIARGPRFRLHLHRRADDVSRGVDDKARRHVHHDVAHQRALWHGWQRPAQPSGKGARTWVVVNYGIDGDVSRVPTIRRRGRRQHLAAWICTGAESDGGDKSDRKMSHGAESLLSLLNFVDLVGNEAMRVAVNRVRGFLARRIDEAENLAGLLVDPVAEIADAVPGLLLEILQVRVRNVLCRDASFHVVHVQVERHGRFLLENVDVSMLCPVYVTPPRHAPQPEPMLQSQHFARLITPSIEPDERSVPRSSGLIAARLPVAPSNRPVPPVIVIASVISAMSPTI